MAANCGRSSADNNRLVPFRKLIFLSLILVVFNNPSASGHSLAHKSSHRVSHRGSFDHVAEAYTFDDKRKMAREEKKKKKLDKAKEAIKETLDQEALVEKEQKAKLITQI